MRRTILACILLLAATFVLSFPSSGGQTMPRYYVRLYPAGPLVSDILDKHGVEDFIRLEGSIVARLTLDQMTSVYNEVTQLQEGQGVFVSFESVPRQTYEMGLQPWEIGQPVIIEERIAAETTAPQVAAIVVEESIYDDIQPAIDTYVSDVTSRWPNLTLLVYQSSATTPEDLRSFLQDIYDTEGIQGAILVGSLPYAQWEMPWGESCSLPLFYEDLDGVFLDQDSDGLYDYRDWGTNEDLEIWVSWIRPPATTGSDSGAIVSKYRHSGGGNLDDSFYLGLKDGHVLWQLNAGDSYSILTGNRYLADGQWHHIAVTWDGTQQIIYVDGHTDNTRAYSGTGSINATEQPLTIGRTIDFGSPGRYLEGTIDEVRIWDAVRTEAEIESAMSHPLQGNEAGLKAYWRMDEATGSTTVSDASGHGNNGTLQGGARLIPSTALISTPGNALTLDGVDSYVSVPDSDSLESFSAVTVEAWVKTHHGQADTEALLAYFDKIHAYHSGDQPKPARGLLAISHDWSGAGETMHAAFEELYGDRIDQLGGDCTSMSVVSKFTHNSGTDADDSFYLAVDKDLMLWQLSTGDASAATKHSAYLANGQWHHIAVTWDGDERTAYIDGEVGGWDYYDDGVSGPVNPSELAITLGRTIRYGEPSDITKAQWMRCGSGMWFGRRPRSTQRCPVRWKGLRPGSAHTGLSTSPVDRRPWLMSLATATAAP